LLSSSRFVEGFIRSDTITILPALLFEAAPDHHSQYVVQHIWQAIRFENTESPEPI
jgi:hypothetical protein